MTRRKRRIAGSVGAVLAVLLAAAALWLATARHPARLFGTEVWQTVKDAEQVQVYRVDRELYSFHRYRVDAVLADPRNGQPVVPDSDWVRQMRSVLSNPFGYINPVRYKCEASPVSAARFTARDRQVDVLFSECGTSISIAPAGQVRWVDAKLMYPRVTALMRRVLPNERQQTRNNAEQQ